MIVAKMRITEQAGHLDADDLGVHPGTDWFTVLSGTVVVYSAHASSKSRPGRRPRSPL